MQNNSTPVQNGGRAGERGAALITMLLVGALVLAAGGALIVSTATTATNAIDASAEKQAYYAAEAGLQMALNALRGNTQHDASVAAGVRMSFRTAVMPDLSNGSGRNGGNNQPCGSTDATTSRCRFAAWLPYPSPATATSIITVDDPADAAPPQVSFRTTVYDPDDSHNVSFKTSGKFILTGGVPIVTQLQNGGSTLLLGVAPNQTKIEFIGKSTPAVLNNAVPSAATDFGSFVVTKLGTGVTLPATGTLLAKFELTVDQTGPWAAQTVFRSTLLSIGSCPSQFLGVKFNKLSQEADGTTYSMTADDAALKELFLPCVAAGSGTSTKQVQGTVNAPAPKQLVIRSWGFGPKWSQKRLEMHVNRANFVGDFPATITLRGGDICPPNSTIDTGNSNAKEYSGHDKDVAGAEPLPVFAVNSCDVSSAESGIKKHETVNNPGEPEIGILDNGTTTATTTEPTTPVDMPSYLKDPNAARDYLQRLKDTARAQRRYFKPAPGSAYTVTNADGTSPNNYGFTFVDGDCNLDTTAPAAGLLVVTGNLLMSGNPSFDGVVLVLGQGSVNRDGGGNGVINGSMIVANFDPWPEVNGNPAPFSDGLPHSFGAVTFNTNGGGNSTMQFSSVAISNAMAVLGAPRVSGVIEF